MCSSGVWQRRHASIPSIPLEEKQETFRVVRVEKVSTVGRTQVDRGNALSQSLSFTVRYEKWPTRIPLSPPVLKHSRVSRVLVAHFLRAASALIILRTHESVASPEATLRADRNRDLHVVTMPASTTTGIFIL